MNRDIASLGNKELHLIYLEERKRFSEGLDKGIPWDTMKEICSSLKLLGDEVKKRDKAQEA